MFWHHRLGYLSYENMKKIRAEDAEFNTKDHSINSVKILN